MKNNSNYDSDQISLKPNAKKLSWFCIFIKLALT